MVYFRAHQFLNGFKLVQERKVPYGDSLSAVAEIVSILLGGSFYPLQVLADILPPQAGSHLHGEGVVPGVLRTSLLL